MTTLADLDRTQRTIPSEVIRQMTGDRTGHYLHNHLWCDMRRCAGIQSKQRKLTQLEAIRLIAVTVTWQETRQLPRTLMQVNRVASELLGCCGTEEMLTALQERKLSADELREAIVRVTGRKPAERTLYLWGHQIGTPYGRRRQYSPSQVKSYLAIASTRGA